MTSREPKQVTPQTCGVSLALVLATVQEEEEALAKRSTALCLEVRLGLGLQARTSVKVIIFVLKTWEINRSYGQEGFLISVGHWPKTRTPQVLM